MDRWVDCWAAAIALPISLDSKPGVVKNLVRLQAIAPLVMDFPLAPDLEQSPTFDPGEGYELSEE